MKFTKTTLIFCLLMLVLAPSFSTVKGAFNTQVTLGNPTETPTRIPYFARAEPDSSGPGVQSILPASAAELALAMDIPSGDLVSASIGTSSSEGTGIGDSTLSNFPRQGSTFTILSTGLATYADDANNSGSLSYMLSGLNNNQGNDMVQLDLQLRVPSNKSCLSFDFAFYSEEFPEFVGSNFNDAFTAEIGGSDVRTLYNYVVTSKNFAYDTRGAYITVNTVSGVTSDTGTTYDGKTPMLTARTPVTPNSQTRLVFTIQDLGDSIYDSTIFLDNFRWSTECGSVGSNLRPPLILVHGFQGLSDTNLHCDPNDTNAGDDIVRYSDHRNNPNDAIRYWGSMPGWFEDGTDYEVWVAQLETNRNRTPSLLYNAGCLIDQINYVYSQNPQPIVLIGHSMGGLVSRAATIDPDVRNKIKAIFTSMSPNAGLPVATFYEYFSLNCNTGDANQLGICNMSENSMVYFNAVARNQSNIDYTFLGGDINPSPHTYFGDGPHDGLVGAWSAVGWTYSGNFLPSTWDDASPPEQIWVDEVHSRTYLGPNPTDYRLLNPGYIPSYTFLCILSMLNNLELPSMCREPQPPTILSVAQATGDVASNQLISSITGNLNNGESANHSVHVDGNSASQFSLSWSSGTISMSLTTPLGDTIDPAYTATHPDEVGHWLVTAGGGLPLMESYTITTTLPGEWQINLYGYSLPDGGMDYTAAVFIESQRKLSLETNANDYHIGNSLGITATLMNGVSGIPGASVFTELVRSDGIIESLMLTDQGNGTYTGSYTVPAVPGYLGIGVTAQGVDHGTPFQRETYDIVAVKPQDFHLLLAPFIDLINNNGDGLYESINLDLPIEANDWVDAIFQADLEAGGTTIAQAYQEIRLHPGVQIVTLRFKGDQIRLSGLNGPYNISRLVGLKTDNGISVLEQSDLATTGLLTWNQFGECHSLVAEAYPDIGGSVVLSPSPNCADGTRYSINSIVQIQSIPENDFNFAGWLADASGTQNPVNLTVDGDKYVVANFFPGDTSGMSQLSIFGYPHYVLANGVMTATITAMVIDTNLQAVEGENIVFSTDLGTLNVISDVTDSSGIASAILTSSTPGTATLTATHKEESAETTIEFVSQLSSFEYVNVVAVPATLKADGVSTSTLYVTGTINGDPAIGSTVSFNTSLGEISPNPLILDESGCGTATFTAPTISGIAKILAEMGDASYGTSIQLLPGQPAHMTISSDQTELPADEISTALLSATLTDANGNPIPGETILFTTTLGNVTPLYAITDQSGVATTSLTAGTEIGTAQVTARTWTLLEHFLIDLGTTYTLTVNTAGTGAGSVTDTLASGTLILPSVYAHGSVVTLTATANAGSHFVRWSGNVSGTINPITITMDADKTVTATFDANAPITYTLTVNTAGTGSVTKNPDTPNYAAGTVVTLTASPIPTSTFGGWSGAVVTTTNPLVLTMDGNKSVTATFTLSNQPPVANAGTDQMVEIASLVTLDGSGSFDLDGNLPLTYGWTQTGGPAVTFSLTVSRTTFTAPNAVGVLTFTLTVTDSLGLASNPDEVVITTRYFCFLPLIIKN